MCDCSLHAVKSRPAKVGDKLATRNIGTGTPTSVPFQFLDRPGQAVSVGQ
jgi:hypothetical protein